MTSGPDISSYDPFEDTGDWPFRDAPPRPATLEPESAPAEERRLPEIESGAIGEDTELEASVVEPEPMLPGPEPESEPEPPEPEPEEEPSPWSDPEPWPQPEQGHTQRGAPEMRLAA